MYTAGMKTGEKPFTILTPVGNSPAGVFIVGLYLSSVAY